MNSEKFYHQSGWNPIYSEGNFRRHYVFTFEDLLAFATEYCEGLEKEVKGHREKNLPIMNDSFREKLKEITRTFIWKDIFKIVRTIRREKTNADAPDAFSVTTDVEKLFIKWLKFKIESNEIKSKTNSST